MNPNSRTSEYRLTEKDFQIFRERQFEYEVMADKRAVFTLGLLSQSGDVKRADFSREIGLDARDLETIIQKLDRAGFVQLADDSISVTHPGQHFLLDFFRMPSSQQSSSMHSSAYSALRPNSTNALQDKIRAEEFDVFLCHNSKDKPEVKLIGEQLKARAILPWLDEWELRPGLPWQKTLEQQILKIKSAAVFVGNEGIGPWQDMELAAILRQFVKRGCPVIPIILPECKEIPQLPIFLEGMTWVDFRKQIPDPMEQLVWGITGEREFK